MLPRRLLSAIAAPALALSVLGAAPTASAAPAAPTPSAPTPAAGIPLSWKLDVATTVAKTGQAVGFTGGSFTGVLEGRTLTGSISLPATTTTMKLGSLPVARATMRITQVGSSTAAIVVDGPVWHVTASQRVIIRIDSLTPVGLPINLVGSNCRTSAPANQTLAGDIDFSKSGPGGPFDYHLTGSYTIPSFTGCGLLTTPILNLLIAGPNNPIDAHFT